MDTKKLIRMGKEGDLIPTEINFLSDSEKVKIYSQLMAIFLKQGVIFDKVFLERRGDGLSLAIHGTDGNMMFYHRNIEFEKNKTKFPVAGDFMLEATSNKKKEEKILTKIEKTRTSNQSRAPHIIRLTGRGRRRSNSVTIPTSGGNNSLDIGISCIRIPIICSRILYSTHKISGLTTVQATGNVYRPDLTSIQWLEKNGASQEFPLMTHSLVNYSNYSNCDVNSTNLIYSQKESIIKKILPNRYDMTNIVCLYEMPVGTTHSLLKKINKKAPFGRLEISYDNTEQDTKLAYKVVNSDTIESVTVENRKPIYSDKSHNQKGVISIDYGTWFDTVKTHRSGSSSFNNIIPGKVRLSQQLSGIECTELLGISKSGKIVYGLKYSILRTGKAAEEIIVMSTIGQHDISPDYDDSVFDVKVVKPKKRGRPKKVVTVEKPEVTKEDSELVNSPIYMKWRVVSDSWYKERNIPIETSVTAVFNGYLNSAEEITDEDIKEFNRLK